MCFNRYMVECELHFKYQLWDGTKVLIDTWWNVNVNYANETLYTDTVLIDTWWNVNQKWKKEFSCTSEF